MLIQRHFTKEGESPYNAITWETRTAEIKNPSTGEITFRQEGVEVPDFWSQRATNIVASKYFYGDVSAGNGSPADGKREYSVRQLVARVVNAITQEGIEQGTLTVDEAVILNDELAYLLLRQFGAFNSPVWFNVGLWHSYGITGDASNQIYGWVPGDTAINANTGKEFVYGKVEKIDPYERPQASACFILGLDDSIEDIWRLMADSARLFKYGSGIGSDWSRLRSSKDRLSGGGTPSGPVSFMKVQDTTGGTIKSGGKTRRAAIMQTLRVWHPDIEEFVNAKQEEEKKAWALIEQGYDGSFNGPAYGSVAFQNVNQSVRIDDGFMRTVTGEYQSEYPERIDYALRSPTTNEILGYVDPKQLLQKIAEGTHICGDPGVQYEDTIQKWNPVKASGQINSSNPCSEYMFLDDSACNLASLNLKRFYRNGTFDVEGFRQAVCVFITAMDILVDLAGYPTALVAQNSHDYRPLGLGFANLGALLMAMGLPYDSDEGRNVAGAIMALEHGESYCQSSRLAQRSGPFTYWEKNWKPFIEVLTMHHQASEEGWRQDKDGRHDELWWHAERANEEALRLAERHGIRNAQVTNVAPTGTISFMMDCDTTGIEPCLGLVTYKLLAGKGDAQIKIVNETVPEGLRVLGYSDEEIESIRTYIKFHDTIVDAEYHTRLKKEHLPIFATSFGSQNTIPWQAHLKMMAAVQPFCSGAISKTINMPESSTVEDIMQAYVMGWELGLKAVAIYRDGSKRSQPVSVKKQRTVEENQKWLENFIEETDAVAPIEVERPIRKRLPDERPSITHKFSIAGHEGYLHIGLYPDTEMPGEIFITMAKQGSTVAGMMDAFATAVSMAMQYGVPLEDLCTKFRSMRFEPSGFTTNPEIPIATSVMDYIFRYLEKRFLASPETTEEVVQPEEQPVVVSASDAPACSNCGSITVRAGSCYSCPNCGSSTGCG